MAGAIVHPLAATALFSQDPPLGVASVVLPSGKDSAGYLLYECCTF
ncbi:MAG: hypothetical protein NXI22_11395 [bacterium]|nr:hypothetical protein [bacterium]